MGHIVKTEHNTWQAVIEVGRNRYTKKRKRKYKTFNTKQEAEEWLIKMKSEQNEGYLLDPSSIKFKDFSMRWLKKHKKNKIAKTTYREYKFRINAHLIPAFGELKMKDIEGIHIEDYFDYKRRKGNLNTGGPLTESTLKKHYVQLNMIFKRAIKLKIIKYNPMNAVDAPVPEKKEAAVMNKIEFNKLLAAARDDNLIFTFILTTLLTGLRRSEVLGLEWEDIDLDISTIRVHKAYVVGDEGPVHVQRTKNYSSTRTIKVPDKLISFLKSYKLIQDKNKLRLGPAYNKEKDFVFCKENGETYNVTYYNHKIKEYLEKAGLANKGYSILTLRHTFATQNMKNKIEPKIIQEMLGHSTISTTLDIYAHVDLDMQEEAASKLNNIIDF